MSSDSNAKTRTSATVTSKKLVIFKAVAGLKYDEDPMNSAWEEAATLFLKHNKELLKELNMEIGDIIKEDK
nr:hypothetical protein [uncultured Methanobacterium sp.]